LTAIDNISNLLDIYEHEAGQYRVRSRERKNLEFKAEASTSSINKSVRTIAAFANCGGGHIVFGVSDRPRDLVGCVEFPDESHIQNILIKYLSPVPEIIVSEHLQFGRTLFCITIFSHPKPPVIAIRDLQTSEAKNKTVLNQGIVYFRRAGQTGPITGEEFSALLEKRDQATRNTILDYISKGREVGFENVAVADFRQYGGKDDNVTLWVPESAAKQLNIIDRAKLVEDQGAPAYQIRGSVNFTTSSDKDPRKPLLPKESSRALREAIRAKFWDDLPWNESHLRKACDHLVRSEQPPGI